MRAPGVNWTAARTSSSTRDRQALEGGDPLAQALGEVELAAHRALGDRGHLGLAAGVAGEQLDDLVLDEGGVDVHDDEPASAPGQARRRPRRCRAPWTLRLEGQLAAQRGRRRRRRRRTRRSSRGSATAGGSGRCWRRATAIRAVIAATPLARSGAPSTTTAARPLRRRAAVAGADLDLDLELEVGARRESSDRRAARSSASPAASSMARVRWPRTTTCSRSSTSAPTSAMASKKRAGDARPVLAGDGHEQGLRGQVGHLAGLDRRRSAGP